MACQERAIAIAIAIVRTPHPADSFLNEYAARGEYTDCYRAIVPAPVSLGEFVFAFYTTWLFKLERGILARLASKPSTDDEVRELARGTRNLFAAWSVARRDDHQMLLSDFVGRTCSWFRVESQDASTGHGTVLYFGSVVLLSRVLRPEQGMWMPVRRVLFELLMVFHKLYSRALLYLAARRALRLARGQVRRRS